MVAVADLAANVTGASPPSFVESQVASATAAVDVVTRTGLSFVLAGAAAPSMLRRGGSGVEQLGFYADRAAERDASQVFIAPPRVDVKARSMRVPRPIRDDAIVEALRFESPFTPLHPDVDAIAGRRHPNRIARAQFWHHPDGPRPTIIAVHGFAASPTVVNSAFFSLPWFYGNGCDVVLVTLPFHGRRSLRAVPLDGLELFGGGLVRLNEAMLQAVSDIRTLIDHLFERGVPQVGMTGLSLGGYMTSLMAAVEPRLAFAIPNAPAVEMSSLMHSWFPAGTTIDLAMRLFGRSRDDLRDAVAVHSPLTYEPVIDHERLFIIGGLGDRFTPPAQAEMLADHWRRPKMHWYPGNHVLHLQRGEYLREMGRFLRSIEFSTGADPDPTRWH